MRPGLYITCPLVHLLYILALHLRVLRVILVKRKYTQFIAASTTNQRTVGLNRALLSGTFQFYFEQFQFPVMLYAAILLKLTSWLQSTNRPPPNFLLGGAAGMHWIRCNQNGRYVRNLRFSDDCKLRAESFFRIYPELLAKQANSKKEHDRACVRF